MKYSNIPAAQNVLLHCKNRGIKQIVISPGSRNAPLIISFTEDPFFVCFSIIDERSAAFFALGLSQQSKEPVALVCTSGSALLNYYPAIAEAFYSDIPLVIISADRPSYKIDIGDGQTIRQKDVFKNHIGYSVSLGQDVIHATETISSLAPHLIDETKQLQEQQNHIQKKNDLALNRALNYARKKKAPVHINIPFEEPLYGIVDKMIVSPQIDSTLIRTAENITDIDHFRQLWHNTHRKIILIGVNQPNAIEQKYLDHFARDPSVLVFTESTSNVHHDNFLSNIDSVIAPIEKSEDREAIFKNLQPKILLTFGGMIVSKKVKAFLREYPPEHHWHVDEKKAYNTFFCLSHYFKMPPNKFFKEFLKEPESVPSNFQAHWFDVKLKYRNKRSVYLKKIPFSDFLALHHIFKRIPRKYNLQLANSTIVRYAQLFDLDPTISVYSNRGTSGIDGSISTAVGAAVHAKEPTLIITGDLSFFYDSNALWNKYTRSDFRIILINNHGGGIFRILPAGEKDKNFETYFETVHDLNAEHLCRLYNVDYQVVVDLINLKSNLSTFYRSSDKPRLLEIITPRKINDKVLLDYFEFIS